MSVLTFKYHLLQNLRKQIQAGEIGAKKEYPSAA